MLYSNHLKRCWESGLSVSPYEKLEEVTELLSEQNHHLSHYLPVSGITFKLTFEILIFFTVLFLFFQDFTKNI